MEYGRVKKSSNQSRPPAKKQNSKVDVYAKQAAKRGSSLAAYTTNANAQTMSPHSQPNTNFLSSSQLVSDRNQTSFRPKPNVILSDDEKQKFGNRCPNGFRKIQILGKGGIAIVWLAVDLSNG